MAWKKIIFFLNITRAVRGAPPLPVNPLVTGKGDSAVVKEIMERKDRIVQMSSQEADGNKPVLLLLHGATDDPTEMMDIVREWRGKKNMFFFSYKYHSSV